MLGVRGAVGNPRKDYMIEILDKSETAAIYAGCNVTGTREDTYRML